MNAIVRHTGADALVAATTNLGIDVCFANPGTTELALVKALDAAPATRAVLCLFEGVCTGAADGFGRMAKRPALTLTHLGPGFANGIANLHNARRAHSPIINLIGDHASWHSAYDPPLHSDIDALARTVGWVGRSMLTGIVGSGCRRGLVRRDGSSTRSGDLSRSLGFSERISE